MDVGRNNPCPCGSGKKYKKCCLKEKLADAEARFLSAPPVSVKAEHPGFDMSPYAISQLMEKDDTLASQDKKTLEALKHKWTPKKIRPLATDDIVARLQKLGIVTSKNTYCRLASGRTSAWSISEVWIGDLRGLQTNDLDFIGQAACELWRRYCPELVSIEMVDDWMQDAYDIQYQDAPRACDIWQKVWDYFKTNVIKPDMHQTDAVDPLYYGLQCFSNWVQDYETALLNAARRDSAYAEKGIAFASEFMSLFPKQDDDWMRSLRHSLSEMLCLSGRQDEGEKVALSLIEECPELCGGYIAMSNTMRTRAESGDPAARQLQLEWLEKAKATARDAEDFDLSERIKSLKKVN